MKLLLILVSLTSGVIVADRLGADSAQPPERTSVREDGENCSIPSWQVK
ncbi:hypothetical protein ABQG65_02500 [Yersinia alsatica]